MARVPRNVMLWILLIKYIVDCKMDKDKDRGIWFHERGGIKELILLLYYIHPPSFSWWKSGYMNFMGKAMWLFIACNYIKPRFLVVLGFLINLVNDSFHCSPIIVVHSLFIISHGLGHVKILLEEESHSLLVVSNCWLFQKGMDACVHVNDSSWERIVHN